MYYHFGFLRTLGMTKYLRNWLFINQKKQFQCLNEYYEVGCGKSAAAIHRVNYEGLHLAKCLEAKHEYLTSKSEVNKSHSNVFLPQPAKYQIIS